jgi:serine/threonine-protein kinase
VGIILWELLAGRRLFLGETDLETVRQVQSAHIPPIRQFNPKIPPELEKVLGRALARDPLARYQTARELGHDLNAVLFRQGGRAVSSFDIAQLVAPIWDERERKRLLKPDKGSLIGSLIDEALFEFSSLGTESTEREASKVGGVALNLATFENVQDWAGDLGDLGVGNGGERAKQPSEMDFGNLASLEDDAPSRRSLRAAAQRMSSSAPVLTPAPTRSVEPPPSLPEIPQKSGKGGMITLVLLLLVVAGVAGAYFGGLIPSGVLPR